MAECEDIWAEARTREDATTAEAPLPVGVGEGVYSNLSLIHI